MNQEIRIRKIESIDAELLHQLSNLLIEVVGAGASIGFLPPLTMREAEEYWEHVVAPGVQLWVAESGEKVVGTVQLHLVLKTNGSHRAEIAKLMVSPAARRCGIARLLMQTAEEKARNENRTLLVLDTRAGDPSNVLYQSMGYVEAGRIPHYARSADGQLDATVFYFKELN